MIEDDGLAVARRLVATGSNAHPPEPRPWRRWNHRPTLLDESLAEPPPGTTDAFYRAFDPDDILLYLGVTWNFRGRESAHVSSSTWFQFAVRFDIEWFGSRKEVFAAERQAIKAEQPLWNVSQNNFPAPRRRLVEYLIRKDRLDLLAPIITSGRVGKRPVAWLPSR